jgi:hypothetical protein
MVFMLMARPSYRFSVIRIECRKTPHDSFGADARIRTWTGISPQRILSPMRLPFRHVGTPGLLTSRTNVPKADHPLPV